MESKQWQYSLGNELFTLSTNPALLSRDFIQSSFASPSMYWAKPISPDNLNLLLEKSCFLGLYIQKQPSPSTESTLNQPTQIGMARLVTDYVTIAFLTDVYILPHHQGKGLGKWMMQCVRELVKTMPELRRVMFMAANADHAVRFYGDALGARVHDQVGGKVVFMSTMAEGVDGDVDVDV